jgi:hypothetical protein
MHVHANQINPSTQLDRDEDGREKRTEVDTNSGHESQGHIISDWT